MNIDSETRQMLGYGSEIHPKEERLTVMEPIVSHNSARPNPNGSMYYSDNDIADLLIDAATVRAASETGFVMNSIIEGRVISSVEEMIHRGVPRQRIYKIVQQLDGSQYMPNRLFLALTYLLTPQPKPKPQPQLKRRRRRNKRMHS